MVRGTSGTLSRATSEVFGRSLKFGAFSVSVRPFLDEIEEIATTARDPDPRQRRSIAREPITVRKLFGAQMRANPSVPICVADGAAASQSVSAWTLPVALITPAARETVYASHPAQRGGGETEERGAPKARAVCRRRPGARGGRTGP